MFNSSNTKYTVYDVCGKMVYVYTEKLEFYVKSIFSTFCKSFWEQTKL